MNRAWVGLSAVFLASVFTSGASFVNWETPHVHPLDMTPDGTKLLAVNTADAHGLGPRYPTPESFVYQGDHLCPCDGFNVPYLRFSVPFVGWTLVPTERAENTLIRNLVPPVLKQDLEWPATCLFRACAIEESLLIE